MLCLSVPLFIYMIIVNSSVLSAPALNHAKCLSTPECTRARGGPGSHAVYHSAYWANTVV
jgi:hypothetical protein